MCFDSDDEDEIGAGYMGCYVAKHVGDAVIRGEVVDFGYRDRDGVSTLAWTVKYEEKEVVEYTDGTKGQKEDFHRDELINAMKLYQTKHYLNKMRLK